MGYDQYKVPNDCSCGTYFCCFPLALANICPWPLVQFFQISLENRGDKTTHNTFRDCRVHFFRQPFSKQLYMYTCVDCVSRVSVSSVLLAVEILCKNDEASQVKCRQRPFRSVLVFFGSVGKNLSMEDLPGSSLLTTVVHKTLL